MEVEGASTFQDSDAQSPALGPGSAVTAPEGLSPGPQVTDIMAPGGEAF